MGNQNAKKHGFYARTFTETEREDLDEAPPTESELHLVRVMLRRLVMEFGDDPETLERIAMLLFAGARTAAALQLQANIQSTGLKEDTLVAVLADLHLA
jgi:hypothetical protein